MAPLSAGNGRRIGILAGGGSIPREIADSVAARRVPVFIVALESEADASFAPHPSAVVNWGQIARMVQLFRDSGTTDIVIVGRVSRPNLANVRPDFGLLMALPMIWRIIRAGGDDAVLREVIRFFEGKGFRVLGPADVATEIIVGRGPLGIFEPNAEDTRDIAVGLDVVERIGRLDIGQGVVVASGRIEAIEGAEGTDRMLDRVAALRRVRGCADIGEAGGVLIKRPKPGQELRIDLPAIGPETVSRAAGAGLRGVAVLAGKTMAADRHDLIRRADALRLFVAGLDERMVADRLALPRSTPADAIEPGVLQTYAGSTPQRDAFESAVKGARVVAALAPSGVALAVVVVRRHVLAVEACEGTLALLGRVADLRQWGSTGRKRLGVAVLQSGSESGPRVLEAAARAGLEGVVITGRAGGAMVPDAEAVGAAKRLGLFLASIELREVDTVEHESGNGTHQ